MIFLFQRVLTHYQLPIFRKLNNVLGGELVLIYGKPTKESFLIGASEEELPFKTVQVKNIWIKEETAVWQNFLRPFQKLGRPDAVIMEQSPRILSLFPLFFYCRINKVPFILWGHGGSMRRSVAESTDIKDKTHRWLIRKADAFISYTDGMKEELSKITDGDKIFVARNTLDTDTLFSIRDKLEKEGREQIKKRLNLKRKHYICFIGRLLKDKQPDYLIDVYAMVKKTYPDLGLIIIGDGPEETHLKAYVKGKGLEDVILQGGVSNWKESGSYLYASDVMVMPGYVGLSVNHAFCFGLPVITQMRGENGPFHSPEIEYIIEGKTGFICPNGDKANMSRAVQTVLEHRLAFNETVTRFCLENLTVNTMIDGVKQAVNFSLR